MRPSLPIIVMTVALSGCAALQQNAATDMQETDYARVATINRIAQRSGVHVIWINAPRKAVHVSGS